MAIHFNPFTTYGYESPEYFCDRVQETEQLVRLLTNGNNVALISPRRMGKTGLIHHCFQQGIIKENYNTFLIDIYATKSLADMVYQMGRTIIKQLKPWGRTAIDRFLQVVTSLRTGISLDGMGNASWNVDIGDIKTPEFTLDEIFAYLQGSERPCIVAIDEFQAINGYPERNIEALLRTYVQECRNAVFIFSGSQRHMMSEMFASPARPFYQSVTTMNISSIPLDKYMNFAQHHFRAAHKTLAEEVVQRIYQKFDATTWYLQKMHNELFSLTPEGGTCTMDMYNLALQNIINSSEATYQDTLLKLTAKQVALLTAICKDGQVRQLTGNKFIKAHHLDTASSVQKACQALLDNQIITRNAEAYEPYDKFMAIWIRQSNN